MNRHKGSVITDLAWIMLTATLCILVVVLYSAIGHISVQQDTTTVAESISADTGTNARPGQQPTNPNVVVSADG